MVNFYVILMNSTFTICYASLALVIAWELTVKLNNKVGKILQSDNKSFRDRILVTNLLQLLLSSALIAAVRLIHKCPFPGSDYVLGYWLMLLVKLLHFKRETFLQDTIGISSLSLTTLVCHQLNTIPASLLETGSSLVNRTLFTVLPPVILVLLLPLSLLAGLLSLLLFPIRQRSSKLMIIPFCLLLLQISPRYRESSPTTNNTNHSLNDSFQLKHKLSRTDTAACENDPVKYLTLNPNILEGAKRRPAPPLPPTEWRELTVVSSLLTDGRCQVVALDMTASNPVTKYLLTLLNSLLPTLELVPKVTLTGVSSRCSELVGSEIITPRGHRTCHFLEEEISFSDNTIAARLLALLSDVKNSVFDQFL